MQSAIIDVAPKGFRDLALEVRDAGLLERRIGYYSLKIGLTVASFVAGWAALVMIGDSWFCLVVAGALGIAFTQVGFIGHDAGHDQVCSSRRGNRLLGLVVGNVLIGLSFSWWVSKHSAHHAHPNQLTRDPDIGTGIVVSNATRFTDFLERRQAALFLPLLLLRSVGLHVSGVQTLARRRDRAATIEMVLIALHTALYLMAVLLVLSPVKAVAFIAVQQGVFSIYLGCSFAPNHKGMPVLDADVRMSFAERQVVTSRNIVGGRFTDFALGGLNYQIEHHLFPTMPRPNLARAQHMVRAFCLESGFGYVEDSVPGCCREIAASLRAAGAATGTPAGELSGELSS